MSQMFETLIPQIKKKTLPLLLDQVAAADKQQTLKTKKLVLDDIAYCDSKTDALNNYITELKKYRDHVVKMNELNYNENIINELQDMYVKRQALLDQQAAEAFATHYKLYISSIDETITKNDYNAAVASTIHILKLTKILNNPDEEEVIKSKQSAVVNMLLELFIQDCFQKTVHDHLLKLATQDQLKQAYQKCIDQFFTTIEEECFIKYLRFKEMYKCDLDPKLDLSFSSFSEYTHLISTLACLKSTSLDDLIIPFVNNFKQNELQYFSSNYSTLVFREIYERGMLLDVELDTIKDTCMACINVLQDNLINTLSDLKSKYKNENISDAEIVVDGILVLESSKLFKDPIVIESITLEFPSTVDLIIRSCNELIYVLLLYPLVKSSSISGSCEKMLLLPDMVDQLAFEAKEMMLEDTHFYKSLKTVRMQGDHTLQTTRTVAMLFQCHMFMKYFREFKDEHFHDLDYATLMITNIGIPILDIISGLKGKYPQYTGNVPEIDVNNLEAVDKDCKWLQILNFYGFDFNRVIEYFK
eukprot:NODE_266_length_12318_cov_0.301498.p2 type:complete len:530 gc:universal NODE_266_length_12318_cov_0.301498:11248-9659(-)